MNFFRPGGMNPSIAGRTRRSAIRWAALRKPRLWRAACRDSTRTAIRPLFPAAFPSATWTPTIPTAVRSITASPRICASASGEHYEFLASYTWSHAIDDSTDLQSTLTPQDSYFPALDRSTSLFDQRHRFVFSGVYQTGKLGGSGFASKFFSDWTFAPLRRSGLRTSVQHHHGQRRQLPAVVADGPSEHGGRIPPAERSYTSKYSPTGKFPGALHQRLRRDRTVPTLLQLDGNLGRNAGVTPWTVFDASARRQAHLLRRTLQHGPDRRHVQHRQQDTTSRRSARCSTNAGQATSAYDPRQFQFAMKLNW